MAPFAFTSEQLNRVMDAASMLPTDAQPSFVRSVANRVADLPYTVGMVEIEVAIRLHSQHSRCRGRFRSLHQQDFR